MSDGEAPSRPRKNWGQPRTVCEEIGQGRVRQCGRWRSSGPAQWPVHIPEPMAEEPRCTACDGSKARQGVLDQVTADWGRMQRAAAPPVEE
jgi:hypothetical protein